MMCYITLLIAYSKRIKQPHAAYDALDLKMTMFCVIFLLLTSFNRQLM